MSSPSRQAPSSPSCEQPAGLSTSEKTDSMRGIKHESGSNEVETSIPIPVTASNAAATHSSNAHSQDSSTGTGPAMKPQPPAATAIASPSKRSLFSIAPKIRSKRSSMDKSRDGISLDQSISMHSAPTVLIQSPSSSSDDRPLRQPLRSAMSNRTLHESLHRGRAAAAATRRTKMKRCVSFANVNIREYERVLGDNPSVTSGPPLAIGWRYVPEPISMKLDDFEDGKGGHRSSSEYLVPKAVREDILREHADVSRREMVAAIRAIQKEKAQRRKTVVNLSMQKTEEKMEGVKRKIKKILKPSTTYDKMEAKMWDNAHAVAMDKAKRLEESIRKGESVSMRNVYAVGTPCNNILPSRRNTLGMNQDIGDTSPTLATTTTMGENDMSMDSLSNSNQYAPKPETLTKNQQLGRLSSAGDTEDPLDKSSLGKKTEGKTLRGGPLRTSANIVASESESEEIFAKLMLDDVSNES